MGKLEPASRDPRHDAFRGQEAAGENMFLDEVGVAPVASNRSSAMVIAWSTATPPGFSTRKMVSK